MWDPLSRPESSSQEPLPNPSDALAWVTNPHCQAGQEDSSQSPGLPGVSAAWADKGSQLLNSMHSPHQGLIRDVSPFPAPPQSRVPDEPLSVSCLL